MRTIYFSKNVYSSIKTVGAKGFRGLWAVKWVISRFVGVRVGVILRFVGVKVGVLGGLWALEWAWRRFVGVRVDVAPGGLWAL